MVNPEFKKKKKNYESLKMTIKQMENSQKSHLPKILPI